MTLEFWHVRHGENDKAFFILSDKSVKHWFVTSIYLQLKHNSLPESTCCPLPSRICLLTWLDHKCIVRLMSATQFVRNILFEVKKTNNAPQPDFFCTSSFNVQLYLISALDEYDSFPLIL